ncbi:MAG: ribonuclease E inhibitor RraB [Gemmatimonadota bacterium]|nr:ribonuclease E inhibitor RraB [Gemmatimonadota bacterium]
MVAGLPISGRMSTGYAIVRSGPWGKVVEVVWSAEEAARKVERLNWTAPDRPPSYSWEPVWVGRPPAVMPALTPKDQELLGYAEQLGLIDTEVEIRVAFSFTFNLAGARAACEELRALGWPDPGMDEELTGDDCWHAYAHHLPLVLSGESIAALRRQMEDIAERHGGSFSEWDLSRGRGLRERVSRKASG